MFEPGTVEMKSGGGSAELFEASNPEKGVPVYYYLGADSKDELAIDILDEAGNVVRSYASKQGDFETCKISNMDPRLPFETRISVHQERSEQVDLGHEAPGYSLYRRNHPVCRVRRAACQAG